MVVKKDPIVKVEEYNGQNLWGRVMCFWKDGSSYCEVVLSDTPEGSVPFIAALVGERWRPLTCLLFACNEDDAKLKFETALTYCADHDHATYHRSDNTYLRGRCFHAWKAWKDGEVHVEIERFPTNRIVAVDWADHV